MATLHVFLRLYHLNITTLFLFILSRENESAWHSIWHHITLLRTNMAVTTGDLSSGKHLSGVHHTLFSFLSLDDTAWFQNKPQLTSALDHLFTRE
jgi:hypothetical protein